MEITREHISATVIESHIPSISKNIGSISTDNDWKTSVLRKETIADIPPLLRAVKNEEVKIFSPVIINEIEKILNACTVISHNVSSYPTKNFR